MLEPGLVTALRRALNSSMFVSVLSPNVFALNKYDHIHPYVLPRRHRKCSVLPRESSAVPVPRTPASHLPRAGEWPGEETNIYAVVADSFNSRVLFFLENGIFKKILFIYF